MLKECAKLLYSFLSTELNASEKVHEEGRRKEMSGMIRRQ